MVGTVLASLIGMSSIDSNQYLSVLNQAKAAQQTAQLGNMTNNESIDKVSKQFAAVMVSQLLNTMFEAIPVDPNFGGGHGEETWRSVLIDEYGKKIGDTGGFGLADMVKQQLLKNQETRR